MAASCVSKMQICTLVFSICAYFTHCLMADMIPFTQENRSLFFKRIGTWTHKYSDLADNRIEDNVKKKVKSLSDLMMNNRHFYGISPSVIIDKQKVSDKVLTSKNLEPIREYVNKRRLRRSKSSFAKRQTSNKSMMEDNAYKFDLSKRIPYSISHNDSGSQSSHALQISSDQRQVTTSIETNRNPKQTAISENTTIALLDQQANIDSKSEHHQTESSDSSHSNSSILERLDTSAVNASSKSNTDFLGRKFYQRMLQNRSKDAVWAVFSMMFLAVVLFGAVYYSKMWRQRDIYWEGDCDTILREEATPIRLPRVNIKELLNSKVEELKYLILDTKKKKVPTATLR